MSDPSRRQVIQGLAAAAVAAVAGGAAVLPPGEDGLVRWLRRCFPTLSFSDEVARAYVRDHLALDRGWVESWPALQRLRARRSPRSDQLDLAARFLMSTDLFRHGDPTRELTYVAYWDPYLSPCTNPCARFDDGTGG